jgi:hypothetical protein
MKAEEGILERTRTDSEQENRRLLFAGSAFQSDGDWCFMPLGGVEFAEFSEPLETDAKTRVNGESLWGYHFAFYYGKRNNRFPFCLARMRLGDTQIHRRGLTNLTLKNTIL